MVSDASRPRQPRCAAGIEGTHRPGSASGSVAGLTVDGLTHDVEVAGVACGLLHHVNKRPSQRDVTPNTGATGLRGRDAALSTIERERSHAAMYSSMTELVVSFSANRNAPWSSHMGSTGSPANVSANQPT